MTAGDNDQSYCVQGAYIISMDPAIGDLPSGHVHISNGSIVAVDDNQACDSEATRLDGRGRIVMPGFVDTHWHLWNILLRGLVDPINGVGYFDVKDEIAPLYRPEDTFRATRLALAEAARAGFTTVHNWSHNTRSPEDADAAIEAHDTVGLRARFSYGHPHEQPKDRAIDLDDVARVHDLLMARDDGLLHLGVVGRSPNRVTDPAVYKAEWGFSRERGLSICFHCSGKRDNTARYADLMAMYREGLLGPDVLVAHAVHVNAEEIAMMAETRTRQTVCPVTNVRSMGAPPVTDLIDAGVMLALSIDNFANPTAGDMFLQMRGTYSIEQQRRPDTHLSPRRLLQLATLDGAAALDLDDVTGSLTPGKRGDVVVLDTNMVNMVPCADPISQTVLTATPSNVEHVLVDGRPVVRDHQMVTVQEDEVIADARDSHRYLLDKASWSKTQQVWMAGTS